MMHPGYQNADYLGPAGPVDTGLGLLSVRTTESEPICVLANYSMHYVGGVSGLSSDYWGHFDIYHNIDDTGYFEWNARYLCKAGVDTNPRVRPLSF